MNKFNLLRLVYSVLITMIEMWYMVASVIALLVIDVSLINAILIVFCMSFAHMILSDFLLSKTKE